MTEQILSQEEIDALLSAMDEGDIDLQVEEKEEEVSIEPYDLTSQSVMLRDQFYALEEVYDKFSNLLHSSLSSTLQRSIEVDFVSTEMVKFGEFIQAFSNPTGLVIFSMEPLIGSALLAIDPDLMFSLIDCMFGGPGKTLPHVREFTLIEQRMMRKFGMEVLENFEKAWSLVYSIKVSLKKTETKPDFVHLVNPNDLMIIVVYSVKGDTFSGNIHFAISFLMLEPIKDKLSSRYLREKDVEHAWSSQLKALLKDTRLNLTAELGRTRNTVRDILNLKVSDVIHLNNGPEDLITLTVEKVPKYLGFPGVVKGSRAIQITTLLRDDNRES